MTKLQNLIAQLENAITNNNFIKLTVGDKRDKNAALNNVFVKPILLKNELMLHFVYRNKTNDVTKNYHVAEAIIEIQNLLRTKFFNADIFTATQKMYYSQSRNEVEKLIVKNEADNIALPNLQHDKQKLRIINSQAVYLQQLGITSTEGVVKKEMQHKFKQINRYVEIIEGIIKNQPIKNNFTVVDMGSGKGYLTFALFEFLKQKNNTVAITGIEQRNDLVEKCNTIAALSQYSNLQFIQGEITNYTLPSTDMLIALHACDTATDDAIAKGIKASAQYIIVAPCCHKQIRKQIAPTNAIQHITQHGILLERQAEMVTDTIRSLILEAYGYQSKVFDFIEAEHTPKNVMIAAVKTEFTQTKFEENMQKVKALKEIFGIKNHYLEGVV